MAKVTITLEDKGEKTVSFLTEIEGFEQEDGNATPAMCLGMATRALFDNGMLAEAAAVALTGINEQKLPTEVLLAHFKKGQKGNK